MGRVSGPLSTVVVVSTIVKVAIILSHGLLALERRGLLIR